MSIEKKSLISTLKTTKKANAAKDDISGAATTSPAQKLANVKHPNVKHPNVEASERKASEREAPEREAPEREASCGERPIIASDHPGGVPTEGPDPSRGLVPSTTFF